MRTPTVALAVSMKQPGFFYSGRKQYLAHNVCDLRLSDAQHPISRVSRIEQWPKEVEISPRAKFFSGFPGVRESRVVRGRKHETYSALRNAAHNFLGFKRYLNSQGFENVGAAARAAGGAVAMFGHGDTGCSTNERGRGRNVKGVHPIAACATGVEGVSIDLHVNHGHS